MGRSPRVLPPLIPNFNPVTNGEISALKVIKKLHRDTLEAQDNLTKAKILQSAQANKSHTLTFPFRIGDRVQLSTKNQRIEFKSAGQRHVAKFVPRFNGPFLITGVNENKSTVTLDLPSTSKRHPVFHTVKINSA